MLNIFLIVCYNKLCVFGLKHYLNETYETTARISSMSHAIVTSLLSILFLYKIIDFSIYKYSVWYNVIYIVTDIYLFLTKKIPNNNIIPYMIHHIFFIIASYISPVVPTYYARGILAEISTIFLNSLWFAKQKKFYFTNIKLYHILLWVNFLIFRIVNLNLLIYDAYNSKYYKYTIIGVPLLILNNGWFYMLTRKIKSLYY